MQRPDAPGRTGLIGTAWAMYTLTLRLVGRPTARMTVLLWGLHLSFTWHAVLYNHNTLLIFLVALMAWLVLRACQEHSLRVDPR